MLLLEKLSQEATLLRAVVCIALRCSASMNTQSTLAVTRAPEAPSTLAWPGLEGDACRVLNAHVAVAWSLHGMNLSSPNQHNSHIRDQTTLWRWRYASHQTPRQHLNLIGGDGGAPDGGGKAASRARALVAARRIAETDSLQDSTSEAAHPLDALEEWRSVSGIGNGNSSSATTPSFAKEHIASIQSS